MQINKWQEVRSALRQMEGKLKEEIFTERAPAAIGPYSQAVKGKNGMIFVSGQLPVDPSTGQFAGESIGQQTRQSLENVKAILDQSGLGMGDVLKTTVFLDNMEDFAAMNEIYAEYFDQPFPARAAVEVSRLPKGALVEIEAVAE